MKASGCVVVCGLRRNWYVALCVGVDGLWDMVNRLGGRPGWVFRGSKGGALGLGRR